MAKTKQPNAPEAAPSRRQRTRPSQEDVSAVPQQQAAARRQRSRLSQEDVPSAPLEQALRVPRAIADGYAYKPTRPLNVAGAMKIAPNSGPFRMLTGAAIAYGLTSGGAFAPEISITPLGMRIVRPTTEGDDIAAKREAVLKPKVVGDFLRQYDGAGLPPDAIAKNVLAERGVPTDRVDDVLALIIESATTVGLIKEINGKKYIDLAGLPTNSSAINGDQPLVADPAAVQSVATPAVTTARAPRAVSVAAGLNINIQIHIAADASAETIEEIFKNMRRYVLGGDGTTNVE